MTGSQISKIILSFLIGSKEECRNDKKVPKDFHKSADSNGYEAMPNKDGKYSPRQENIFIPSNIFQQNTNKNPENHQNINSAKANEAAENVMRTNTRLKKELQDLQQMNRKFNSPRKRRDAVLDPKEKAPMQELEKGTAYHCNEDLDQNMVPMLQKLSTTMTLTQVENLAKLFTVFIKKLHVSNDSAHISYGPSTQRAISQTSREIYPSTISSVDINQRLRNRNEHERQIQAMSDIISRRKKRSIVDFEKGLHRGFYAHKVDRFPHSMRIKQENEITEDSKDKIENEAKPNPNVIRAKSGKKKKELDDEEKSGIELKSAEAESSPIDSEIETFPIPEKIEKENISSSKKLHSKQSNDKKDKRKKNKHQKDVDIKRHGKKEFPLSYRVIHINTNVPEPTGNDKLSFSGSKTVPSEDVLKQFLEGTDGEKERIGREKRSIVDFNNLERERTDFASREDATGKMAKINRFPDSERTMRRKKKIRNSIFGLTMNQRRPITDFDHPKLNRKSETFKNGAGKANHFPRTERLMAPKALKHRRKSNSDNQQRDMQKIRDGLKRNRNSTKRRMDSKKRKKYATD